MSRVPYLALAAFGSSLLHAEPSTPVILISVDTLRADHLSCYQAGRRPTPNIDALAKNGTLFSQASSPFPLTLPAHAALFTSTYPFANGVQDNGIPLKPTAVTLATVLKKAGYRTGAFVGSFVLDRRFGLNRGFDVYDGPLDVHNKATATVVERKRPGTQVAEAAKNWVGRNATAPFFLFLHLYDLHLPYDLPQDPNLRHGETGYTAELAHVDRILGDFMAFLERRGLLQKALIVFTSDHGEGLGDHGESTHGFFIYQSTLHVPLVMRWPVGATRHPKERVEEPASLLDVAPTILDALGIARPAEMRGRSLMEPGAAREIYAESLYARSHFGCAPLRSARVGSLKYIEASKPELYDLSTDPKEQRNLYEQQRSKGAALSERIAAVRGGSATGGKTAPSTPTSENTRILRSLGYLGGASGASRVVPTVDPKDRIGDFERYFSALGLASSGRVAEANGMLENLRDKLPGVVDVRLSLASNLQQLGQYDQAAREYKRVIELSPSDAQAHFELGSCYFQLRQPDQAMLQFKAALALEPWYTRADEALAEIYLQKKDFPQARGHLTHLLSVDPASYAAHFNLGVFAALEKNWAEAEKHMLAALQADANSTEAHSTLGSIYLQLGDMKRARPQFEEAIRLQPSLGSAHYQLGMILQKSGDAAGAEREFRAAQASDR